MHINFICSDVFQRVNDVVAVPPYSFISSVFVNKSKSEIKDDYRVQRYMIKQR